MTCEINRKADYWATDPEAINRLERHIEFGELAQITPTPVSGVPRYLVTYIMSNTSGQIRSGTVERVTNQSSFPSVCREMAGCSPWGSNECTENYWAFGDIAVTSHPVTSATCISASRIPFVPPACGLRKLVLCPTLDMVRVDILNSYYDFEEKTK